MTKTCQYCHEELDNPRRKMCPKCSEAKTDAYKQGIYNKWLAAAEAASADEALTPEQRREKMAAAFGELAAEQDEKVTARNREEAARKAARKAAKAKREEAARKMARLGYEIWREAIGTEDDTLPGSYYAGIGELAGYRTVVSTPDGRIIPFEQAVSEVYRIDRGDLVGHAVEIWDEAYSDCFAWVC